MYKRASTRLIPGTFAFLLFSLPCVQAQNWTPSTAPALGWASIATSVDGSKLAAVADPGGIYVSTNSARSWKPTTAPRLAWTGIAGSTNGTKWIASANRGVYLSSNSGATWKSVDALSSNSWFSVASSADGTILAVVADHGGIYVSTDSGLVWHQSDAPVEPWSAVAASADGTFMIAVSDPGPIYTSTNSGLNWISNSAPVLSWSAAAASADAGKLFAAATLGGIFASTDLGLTWTKTSATNDSWTCIARSPDGTNLLAGALHSGLYVSSDAGQTWTKTQALGMGWLSVAMSADAASLYAAAYNDGIFVPGSASGLSTTNGTYQGLFYDTNGVTIDSSGAASISVKASGTFSAKLQFAGQSYSCSGKFSGAGSSSNSIPRSGLSPLTLTMQIDPDNNALITGLVSADAWTAELVAYASVFSKTNPCPQVGQYTLAFPGSDDPAAGPAGDGYATVKVNSLGNTSVAGKLGDGTPVSRKTSLSQNGQLPLFASLYSGKGLFVGWLTFSNQADSDLSGPVTWIAPSDATLKIDPTGFTNQLQAAGSSYQFIPGVPVLNMTNGQVSFLYANLPQNFTNQIRLTNNSAVVNLSSNKLACKIVTSSGQFSGSATIPGTKQTVSFAGVILQKLNLGTGYFLGTNQSGRVSFGP
jgi:photosystem II stability/assembly factor-like uncharacterized protein